MFWNTRETKGSFLFPDQQGSVWLSEEVVSNLTHFVIEYTEIRFWKSSARALKKTRKITVPFLFPDQQGSGSATKGVFTYFFWVLLQPFRGNPEYHDVADLPYNSSCLNDIKTDRTDMRSLSKFFFKSYVEIGFLKNVVKFL